MEDLHGNITCIDSCGNGLAPLWNIEEGISYLGWYYDEPEQHAYTASLRLRLVMDLHWMHTNDVAGRLIEGVECGDVVVKYKGEPIDRERALYMLMEGLEGEHLTFNLNDLSS